VKRDHQTPLEARSGVAVVERRTIANSQNVGVAARHVLFKKARWLIYAA
jgi:hypothetical protein